MTHHTKLLVLIPLVLSACAVEPEESVRTVTYLCERGTMMEVDFATELARLRSPGGEIDLTARPVASGFQYSGGGHDLRGKEHELRWTLPSGEVQQCRDQDWAMKQPQIQPPIASLGGSSWTLEYFESSDDAIGRIVPPRLDLYNLTFGPDGSADLQLDCNLARAQWTAEPTSASGGGLTFSPGAMTRAMCGPDAMDARIAADLSRIRSYTLRGGMLYLALQADGGIYAWKPLPAN